MSLRCDQENAVNAGLLIEPAGCLEGVLEGILRFRPEGDHTALQVVLKCGRKLELVSEGCRVHARPWVDAADENAIHLACLAQCEHFLDPVKLTGEDDRRFGQAARFYRIPQAKPVRKGEADEACHNDTANGPANPLSCPPHVCSG